MFRKMTSELPLIIFTCISLQLLTAKEIRFPGKDEKCKNAPGKAFCLEFWRCSAIHNKTSKGEPPIHCGYQGRTPLVCCPVLAALQTGGTSVRIGNTNDLVPEPGINFECGKRATRGVWINFRRKRANVDTLVTEELLLTTFPPFTPQVYHIDGGRVAPRNSWPWMVLLGRKHRLSTEFFCSGTLLNERFVITAAHCILDPRPFFLRLGEHNYDPYEEVVDIFPEDVDVEDVIAHPKYDIYKGYADIALLKLNKSINYTRGIAPICLPWGLLAEEDLVDQSVTLAGWGTTEFGGEPSSVLREVNVTVFPPSRCHTSYSTLRDFRSTFPDGMTNRNIICAGTQEGGKDACEGDSGGPMMRHRSEEDQFILAGIISKGFGCGKKDFPGLYAPLQDHFTLKWIKDVAFSE